MVGDLPKSDPNFGRAIRCAACADWLKESRLTVEERTHTIDHLTERADDQRGEMMALRFMGKQMLQDPYGFLSIWGRKGGGKSLLLTALVAEFCRAKRRAVYFNSGEIVTMLQPGEEGVGGEWKGDADACKRRLKEIPVLAIDEMDKIKWTAYQVHHIGEVIEHRHRHAETHVTILAMNRPPWEWSNAGEVEHIGSRLMDGRFTRRWPEQHKHRIPPCAINGEIPGLFEVTLPDIRPTLRRGDV